MFAALLGCTLTAAHSGSTLLQACVLRSAVRTEAPWELRVAGAVDANQLARLFKLPTSIVSQLINADASCVATSTGKLMAERL